MKFINKLYNRIFFLVTIIIKNAFIFRMHKKKIILLVTPNHGNLGDQAISIAEIDYLKKNYDFPIVEISDLLYNFYRKKLTKKVSPQDIIILHGGGNVGIEYKILEEQRREIICSFPLNQIILFPQTIDFGDSDEGKIEFEKSRQIYSSHENLTILAREEKSYQIFKKYFSDKTYYVPDIVLTMKPKTHHSGKYALTCFRKDVEKTLIPSDEEYLFDIISKRGFELIKSDTYVERSIYPHNRQKIVANLFGKYQGAKFVVTDRLHGMIFAYLNGTTCIVFNNYNGKVEGVYKSWLKKSKNILFLDNVDNFEQTLTQLLSSVDDFTIEQFANEQFEFLRKIIDNE